MENDLLEEAMKYDSVDAFAEAQVKTRNFNIINTESWQNFITGRDVLQMYEDDQIKAFEYLANKTNKQYLDIKKEWEDAYIKEGMDRKKTYARLNLLGKEIKKYATQDMKPLIDIYNKAHSETNNQINMKQKG